MRLKFMEQLPLKPELMTCPYCGNSQRIGVHSRQERRYICHACGKTFAETQGTVFFGLHYPIWVVVLVLTLLAHGCPIAAIVAAFLIDERTVLDWLHHTGQHGKAVQAQVVCNGQVEPGQVQADELQARTQKGKVWIATAVSVFSRLFLCGQVSPNRDTSLVKRLMQKVRQAASSTTQALLIAVDGFAAYPKVVLHKDQDRAAGVPPPSPVARAARGPGGQAVQWPRFEERLSLPGVCLLDRVYEIIAMTQIEFGVINIAFSERFNATLRACLPAPVRRTRNLARATQRLEDELFWGGVVYNFCTVHTSLGATPAVAAGLTDHTWSVEELLRFRLPRQAHSTP